MTYFQVNKNNSELCKKPFVSFSTNEDRANLMTFSGPPSSIRRKRSKSQGRRRRRTFGRGRRLKTRVTKVRIVNGKVALRVAGYPGYQRLGASQLVRFVPLTKLRIAAKRVLGSSGAKRHRRKRRHQRRRSQL
jgi:hypothetical protein